MSMLCCFVTACELWYKKVSKILQDDYEYYKLVSEQEIMEQENTQARQRVSL